jgi:hypothetical protein
MNDKNSYNSNNILTVSQNICLRILYLQQINPNTSQYIVWLNDLLLRKILVNILYDWMTYYCIKCSEQYFRYI